MFCPLPIRYHFILLPPSCPSWPSRPDRHIRWWCDRRWFLPPLRVLPLPVILPLLLPPRLPQQAPLLQAPQVLPWVLLRWSPWWTFSQVVRKAPCFFQGFLQGIYFKLFPSFQDDYLVSHSFNSIDDDSFHFGHFVHEISQKVHLLDGDDHIVVDCDF